jgi:Protein of unknown function (DUF1572)
MESEFLISAKRLFGYYKDLADKSIAQVSEEQLFVQVNEDSNSIALIIQHLAGNMLSRWTDFLTSDGEKEWRNRDSEFEANFHNKEELIQYWENGWSCLFAALEPLTVDDLIKIVYIRNEGHTVMDAILRQLAHYPYHIGQIVYAAKQLSKEEWKSLSIPRNKSGDFNALKFSNEKSITHFTERKNE